MDKQTESRAIEQVVTTKSFYDSLCSLRKNQLTAIYQEVMNYNPKKRAKWASALKVNFANQIESLVTARMTSKNPKFIVSYKMPVDEIVGKYYPVKEPKDDATPAQLEAYQVKLKEREKFKREVEKWTESIQDYLNTLFSEYNMGQRVRQGAKALVRYGNVYGTVNYRKEKYRKRRDNKIISEVVKEYPEIDIVSFTEMFIDPRYIQVSESPAVIRTHERVRLSELHLMKDELINLDKIKANTDNTQNWQKDAIYAILINNASGQEEWKPCNSITVDKYYGYFNPTPEQEDNECLYELWTVNGAVLIKYKEIPRIPFHSAGCFEDVEQHWSIGYVEPILGLEREYNFKMNSAIEFINQALNRTFMWDPQSGVDPKMLSNLAPGSIIPVQNGMERALAGLKELEYREIPQSYFANSNELRRDMQTVSFTVDTAATSSQQGFTNTATAVRARFFESNTVYADTLRHFEEFLVKLAYDVIDSIAENAEDDVIIQRIGKKKFEWASKEIFEDAPLRYAIRVEVGSSSFDSVENRREEALAFLEVVKQMAEAGMEVDFEKVFMDLADTFEKKNPDKYLKRDLSGVMQLLAGGQQPPQEPLAATTGQEMETIVPQEASLNNPAELTQEVVQGNLIA